MQFYHDAICQDLERRRHSTPHTRAEQVSDGVHMELLLKVWLKQINRLVAYPDGLQNFLWETDKLGLRSNAGIICWWERPLWLSAIAPAARPRQENWAWVIGNGLYE